MSDRANEQEQVFDANPNQAELTDTLSGEANSCTYPCRADSCPWEQFGGKFHIVDPLRLIRIKLSLL